MTDPIPAVHPRPDAPPAPGAGAEERLHADRGVEDHDRGLAFDLPRLLDRRRALGLLAGGLGLVTLAACGSSASDGGGDGGGTTTAADDAGEGTGATTAASDGTTEIPEETGGPFPGDGSNGPDVLGETGVVRSDITTSFGGSSGVAEGVPATLTMTLLDVSAGGAPLAGAAVYVWHCDRAGRYSMYSDGVTDQNYLRGVQEADADGVVTFTTIFPAAYDGRWPHVHLEVYESLDAATSAGPKLRTSQVALPEEACAAVYATEGYEQSLANHARTSLDTDLVFSDGSASQVPTTSGSVDDGYVFAIDVGV